MVPIASNCCSSCFDFGIFLAGERLNSVIFLAILLKQ